MTATFTVPYPPSANRLWRNVNGKTLKSEDYRRWMDVATATIIHQRPQKVVGKYDMTIVATRPDNRARDLDNIIKPVSDAVAAAGVVENDSKLERLVVGWSEEGPLPGGAILVSVQPWRSEREEAA